MRRLFNSILVVTLGCIVLCGCTTIDDTHFSPNIVNETVLSPVLDGDMNQLTVLQFNIWQEGTVIEGGFDAIVDEIIRSKADLVALSEVRNYKGEDGLPINFNQKLVDALGKRGDLFYTLPDPSYDTGLISRYPVTDFSFPYPVENDHGSITRAIVLLPYLDKSENPIEVAFYSAHLDYKNCAYYEPRGYDGSTWAPIIPVRNLKKIKEVNLASKRDDAIKEFLKVAKQDEEAGRLVILGGDFNEPSWRDWIEENKNLYDHNGVIYKWDVSVLLEDSGYVDSWREFHPDPIAFPGFTYPSSNSDIGIDKLTWAPRSDERERIDFIYYKPDPRIKLVDTLILGPASSIAYSKEVKEDGDCKILPPIAIWPTDHKAVLSIFAISIDPKEIIE